MILLIFVDIVVASEVKSAASRGKKPVTRPASETDLRNVRRTRPALAPVSSLETCRKLDSSQNVQIKLTSEPRNSSLDSSQSLSSSNKEAVSVTDSKTGVNADGVEAGALSEGAGESNVASGGHASPCGGRLYECVGSLKLCSEESGADGLCEERSSFCREDGVNVQLRSSDRRLPPTTCLSSAQASVPSAASTEAEADKQR